jgi:SAM-dependent methyltransferase
VEEGFHWLPGFTGHLSAKVAKMKRSLFDHPLFMEITNASLSHLESLKLDIDNLSVLEVGAGVGLLTHFFEKRNCQVLSTDARIELVKEQQERYPHRKVEVADLEKPETYKNFGEFDIVFCYGTLYHLSNPEFTIRELAKLCKKYFLLETCVFPIDNGKINLIEEPKFFLHQSFYGLGCRPARNWVLNTLKKYFPYAYITATQPDHPDYQLEWPVQDPRENTRCVFVASKEQLENPLLLEALPDKQSRYIKGS